HEELEGGGPLVAAVPGDLHALEGADGAQVEVEGAGAGAGPAAVVVLEDVLGEVAVVGARVDSDDLDRTLGLLTRLFTGILAGLFARILTRILRRANDPKLRDAVPGVAGVALGGDADVAGLLRGE